MNTVDTEADRTVQRFREIRRGNPRFADDTDRIVRLAYMEGRAAPPARIQITNTAMLLHGFDVRDGRDTPESWAMLDRETRDSYLERAGLILKEAMDALVRPTPDEKDGND